MKTLSSLFLTLLLLSASILQPSADETAPDPEVLIDAMSKASRYLNYDGVFVYRLGNQINSMRIIHKAATEGVYERLISLTGDAREVIRDTNEVRCYFPESKAVYVEKSRLGKLISSYLPESIQTISEFYNFELAGEDRIAGMNAWIVNIRPKDKYRYGYQLWIEKKSKLLLKSELKNQLGITLEQIIFTQLKVLEHIEDALLQPSVSGSDYTWYNYAENKKVALPDKSKNWKVKWLPAGFIMSDHVSENLVVSELPVEHLIYTDGLAMVSIFVEKSAPQPDEAIGPANIGGVNAFSKYIEGHQITAVGEVPKETVRLMAASVKSD